MNKYHTIKNIILIIMLNFHPICKADGIIDTLLNIDKSIAQTYKKLDETFVGNIFLQRVDMIVATGTMLAAMQYLSSTSALQTHQLEGAEVTDTTLKDYIGVPDAVKVLVDQIKNQEKYKKMGVPPTKGILLTGNPGTGKSFLARAIAGEAQCPFFSISSTELQQPYYGMSAAMIRDLFKRAKQAAMKAPSKTAIIFIDEIDAIGQKRGTSSTAGSSTLTTLLAEMDGFSKVSEAVDSSWYEKIMHYFSKKPEIAVVVLGATNVPDAIDPALKRPGRFDRIIKIENPDINAREQIINMHLKKYSHEENITARKVAEVTEGMTPAAIKTIFLEAGRNAVFKGQDKIGIQDLLDAIFAIKQVATDGKRVAESIIIFYPFDASITSSDLIAFVQEMGDVKTAVDILQTIYQKKCGSTSDKSCLISKDDLVENKIKE